MVLWVGLVLGVGIAIFCAIGLTLAERENPLAIPREQLAAVAEFQDKLGAFKSKQSIVSYQEAHEHAIVVWLENRAQFLKLPTAERRKVQVENDVYWLDDSDLADDDKLRNRLGLPADVKPPRNGLAIGWEKYPDRWKWIGGRIFFHPYLKKEITLSQFERGIIVGPYHISERGIPDRLYIVFDDGDWFNRKIADD